MTLEELHRRLQTLEDIEAIKKLKVRYCHCADARDHVGFANLFVDDGVWEGGVFGHGEGRAGIAQFLRNVQEQSLPFALHYVMNAVVEVQDDTAVGQWYLLEPCTMTLADGRQTQAVWGTATYEDHFVRVNGEWKFKKVHLKPVFWTPFEQGWAKKKFIQE